MAAEPQKDFEDQLDQFREVADLLRSELLIVAAVFVDEIVVMVGVAFNVAHFGEACTKPQRPVLVSGRDRKFEDSQATISNKVLSLAEKNC